MIPKPLYEALPYFYFFVGGALWIVGTGMLEICAGILLYFAGAQQWVLRSNYRRRDRFDANLISVQRRHEDSNDGLYPRWLYEMLPFLYIGLGYQLANLMRHPHWQQQLGLDSGFTLTAVICLTVAGFLVLTLRGVHRYSLNSHHHHNDKAPY